VKGVAGCFVVEYVCDDGGHAVLALELGALDALEALRVRLLAEDLLLVRQHELFLR
jgi:hypothetical protein